MARLRDLKWDDYGIDKFRYQELRYFCLQYPAKLKGAEYTVQSSSVSGGRRPSGISRPTEAAAVRNVARQERAQRDLDQICSAAKWAASAGGFRDAWRSIVEHVAYKKPFDTLDVPFSVADFYGIRRAFYYALDCLQQTGALPQGFP